LATLGPGLVLYVSSFDDRSYVPGFGKTWRNIAQNLVTTQQCNADGTQRDMNLYFKTTPALSRKNGFMLGTNTITGPLSHQLGVNGDTSFTIVTILQITGDVGAKCPVFKLFANTPNNNGITLELSNGTRVGDMITADMTLMLGNMMPMVCQPIPKTGQIMFDPRSKYMFVVSKDYGALSVATVNIDAGTYEQRLHLDTNVGAHDSIIFSNMDMVLNPNGNLNANITAFGIWTRALDGAAISRLYDRYRGILRTYDPMYAILQQQLSEVDRLKACPYDQTTCATCPAAMDWSSPVNIVSTATVPCLRAVDKYCTANPSHRECACWSSTHPEYEGTCKAYRAIYSGAMTQDQGPSEPPGVDTLISNILSTKNVDAVSRLVGAISNSACTACGSKDNEKEPPKDKEPDEPGKCPPKRPPPPTCPPRHPKLTPPKTCKDRKQFWNKLLND
jgi:hypothetical protein